MANGIPQSGPGDLTKGPKPTVNGHGPHPAIYAGPVDKSMAGSNVPKIKRN